MNWIQDYRILLLVPWNSWISKWIYWLAIIVYTAFTLISIKTESFTWLCFIFQVLLLRLCLSLNIWTSVTTICQLWRREPSKVNLRGYSGLFVLKTCLRLHILFHNIEVMFWFVHFWKCRKTVLNLIIGQDSTVILQKLCLDFVFVCMSY